jgi:HTH-type transcriptional regulator/antitoxin HigA
MNIHPIHTETDYKEALKKVSALVDKDPERGTPDGDMLEILGMLVAAYEAKHYPMESPDPVEAIKFRME